MLKQQIKGQLPSHYHYMYIIIYCLYCRCHIVNQFNENLYDIIIAADELSLDKPMEDTGKKKNKGNKK